MRNTETCSVCYHYTTQNQYMYGILLLTLCLNVYILWKTRHELINWLRTHYERDYGSYRLFKILINLSKKSTNHQTIDALQNTIRCLMSSYSALYRIHVQNVQTYEFEIDSLKNINHDLSERIRFLWNYNDDLQDEKSELLNEVLLINKHSLRSQAELNTTRAKIKDLEKTLQQYENTITQMQSTNKTVSDKETIRECSICFEAYSQDRKQVAFSPCGHAPSCEQCVKSENFVRKCPICRTKIKRAVALEGIY